ncbi:MAG: ATP synthase F1 subunit gamma [Bacteroidia bacterium]|nr:ATP synthase F1 subunit gamma [Bacteroidia bacterium]MDW8157426.1 ATP synthase F1 subunit gamma [Bacteroidia bacterium]
MPSLKDIRNRIKSVQSTQQTTKAMKLVAASKLRKAQELIFNLRPYSKRLSDILHHLAATDIQSPFLESRPIQKVLLVVVTSNKGLCGAFNNAICKLALHTIQTEYQNISSTNIIILAIGKKAHDFFRKSPYQIIGEEYDVFHHLSFDYVSQLANLILEGYLNQKWDKVTLVYNSFKNIVVQLRMVETFLPITLNKIEISHSNFAVKNYLFEPEQEIIISQLVPVILKTNFYRIILDSNAAEHGARMVAMDKATENADALIKELRLQYNKARQASITKEILEIVGGAEALATSN